MFNIFSSYLHEDFFNLDTKKIKKCILNNKFKSKGKIISNYGGWQSENFKLINKNFKHLFDNIDTSVIEIEKNLNLKNKLILSDYWFNVNCFGSFNKPHTHLGSVLSGVYYIQVPKNSGNLIFEHNALSTDTTYQNIKNYNQYNSSMWTCKPKENLCILFPSYLSHYVESNLNKKKRISISFNYVI
jgi:uncharacterized protein (TIGR02466 family)